jgi:AraC-like DNA-binding protein
MTTAPWATTHHIHTRVSHLVRTLTVRDDLVGCVISGSKRLVSSGGDIRFDAGQVFVIPRATQWDIFNDTARNGDYEARLMSFAAATVDRFHERFGQFAAIAPVQGCAATPADGAFRAVFEHASAALEDHAASATIQEHRALEVLLLLAERGLVLTPARDLSWTDRVHRLVQQRPHAPWSVDTLARAFHVSASTLQRRLGEEGSSVSACVREVRLQVAMALLQSSDLQVSAIAVHCGYDSHSRFSAAFRQRFGYPPSHLR